MNHVVLMGRLTRDPELRHTQSGVPVVTFSIAVNRRFAAREGEQRQVDFIDVVAWRQSAEFVQRYFAKGQMCAVQGRLQIREWEDKEGNRRRNAEVIAEHVHFTGSRRESGNGDSGYPPAFDDRDAPPPTSGGGYPADGGMGGGAVDTPTSDFAELEDDDGDLPF